MSAHPSANGAAETLRRLADAKDHPRISVGEIMESLDRHGFGLLVLILALPNAIPGPIIPGFSTPFAICIALLGLQLLRGRHTPLLPGWLLRRSIARVRFRGFVKRAEPFLLKLERWFKPRTTSFLGGALDRRSIGGALIIFALVLALPIPLGNGPIAFAICVVGLGLFENDERLLTIGAIGGVLAVFLNAALVVAGVELFDTAKRFL